MTNQEWIDKFVNDNLSMFKGSDKDVLTFIGQVLYNLGPDNAEAIDQLFGSGYCYYFACMLRDAFQRGTVCCTGSSHIVWLDGTLLDRDIAYDIHGVNCNYEVLIPVSAMGNALIDFKHVPGKEYGTSKQEIDSLISYWKGRPTAL